MNVGSKFNIGVFSVIVLVYLVSLIHYQRWNTNILGGGDTYGYYCYLPAALIHGDLASLKQTQSTRKKYHPGFNLGSDNPLGIESAMHLGEGRQVIKYTMGVALLELPFFGIGHVAAKLSGAGTDGFSFPYILSIHLGSLIYVFLGLILLFRVLRAHFDRTIAAMVTLAVALATNLYFFTIYSGPMAHSYLFALYCLLMYATWKFFEIPSWWYALLIGLSMGMITLIRPVEVICLIIPLTYGLSSIKNRGAFLMTHWSKVLGAALAFLLAGLPQLIYWKWITGSFFFYSYGDERFNFLDPQIWNGLTSYQNGWLIYTPVMALALLGIPFLLKDRRWLYPVLFFLPIHIYITYSWWCWNYINGFGSRPMVESYALLAVPLGYFFIFIRKWKITHVFGWILILFFSALNIFQTYQFHRAILWTESANKAYYWSVFGKTKLTYNDLVAFDTKVAQPDSNQLSFVKVLYRHGFEDSLDANYTSAMVHSGKYAYLLDQEQKLAKGGYVNSVRGMDAQPGDYLRYSVWCRKETRDYQMWGQPVLVARFDRGEEVMAYQEVRIQNKLDANPALLFWGKLRTWDKVHFFIQVPPDALPEDTFSALVYNQAGGPVFIDDIRVELWRSKE